MDNGSGPNNAGPLVLMLRGLWKLMTSTGVLLQVTVVALLTAISMLEVPRQFAYVCIFYVTRTFRRTLNAYAISLVEGGSKSAATHNLIFFGLSLKGSLPILQKPTTAHSSHLL